MASSVAETSLQPFEGPLPLFPVAMLQQQTYSPSPFYERTLCRIFFPPGCRQLSLPFSLSLSFFPFHFHFYCHSMSPLLFLLLFTNFFSFLPFLCFLLFHIGSWTALPVLLRHFSCHPSLPQFSTKRLHSPPLESRCYWIAYCSHLLPPLVFLIVQFLGLPALYVVILPWSSAVLWHLPILFFDLCCYLFPYTVLIFT